MKKLIIALIIFMLSAGVSMAAGGKNRGTTGSGTTSTGTSSQGTSSQTRSGR